MINIACETVGIDRNTQARAVDKLDRQFIAGEIDMALELAKMKDCVSDFADVIERNEDDIIENVKKYNDTKFKQNKEKVLKLIQQKREKQKQKAQDSFLRKHYLKEKQKNDLRQKLVDLDSKVYELTGKQFDMADEINKKKIDINKIKAASNEISDVLKDVEQSNVELLTHFKIESKSASIRPSPEHSPSMCTFNL